MHRLIQNETFGGGVLKGKFGLIKGLPFSTTRVAANQPSLHCLFSKSETNEK